MIDGRIPARPSVMVYTLAHPELPLKRREVQAGLEEEGIPWVVEDRDSGEATALAFQAAGISQLGVGVAIGAEELCVHYYKLPAREPLFRLPGRGTPAEWRLIGCNAARLVKGIAFKQPADEQDQEKEAMADTNQLVDEIVNRILRELRIRR